MSENRITLTISTFERPKALERLLQSIERYAPKYPVLIADDSPNPYAYSMCGGRKHWSTWDVSKDAGAGRKRNRLIRAADTDYILMLDDDLELTGQTDIPKLLDICDSFNIDVAAGRYTRPNSDQPDDWTACFTRQGDSLTCHKVENHIAPFTLCHMSQQFALMRRKTLLKTNGSKGPWDDEQKLADHIDGFLQMWEDSINVAVVDGVWAKHHRDRPEHYVPMRNRHDEYESKWMKKRGVRKVIFPNGKAVER